MTLALLITAATGAWAQTDEVTVTTVTKGKQWTFTMPASNVELTPIYEPEFTATFKAGNANTIQGGKANVTVTESGATTGTDVTDNIGSDNKLTPVYEGQTITLTAAAGYKFKSVEAKKKGAIVLLSAATTDDIGKVVCNKGHLHDAKTAVPAGCTAVGILGKVTETGHGLILALQNANSQNWNTINGWTSVTTYASTTLKVLPDDAARGTNLTSYTTLGETAVSNWAVGQESDYEAIFINLGSTNGSLEKTYDGNVNAYITTGVGGAAISGVNWSATEANNFARSFSSDNWANIGKHLSRSVRPVLGF